MGVGRPTANQGGLGRSENDDCARTRSLTGFERRDGLCAAERKVRDEIWRRETKGPSVVARVRDEEDHHILAIVAALQGSPAGARLYVSESRFGIDGNVPIAADNSRIPCPSVAGNSEWHLSPPSKARSQVASELGQQSQLGNIANRLPGRIDAHWEVQTQNGGEHHQRFERDPWSLAQLDAADLGVRNPNSGASLSLSQARAEPRLPQFLASELQGSPSESPPAIAQVLAADHPRRMTVMPHLPITGASKTKHGREAANAGRATETLNAQRRR